MKVWCCRVRGLKYTVASMERIALLMHQSALILVNRKGFCNCFKMPLKNEKIASHPF